MDWKSLVDKTKSIAQKAKPLVDKTKVIAQKASPVVKKMKWYGSEAVAYVWKQIEQTPIFLRTEEEYNEFLIPKTSILVAYDSTHATSEDIRIMMPIWATQAWTDAAELKYIEISDNVDLAKTLKINWPIEMRVAYMGEEYGRFGDIDTIKAWWKSRNYIQDENIDVSITEKPESVTTDMPDPLIDIEKKPKTPVKKKPAAPKKKVPTKSKSE